MKFLKQILLIVGCFSCFILTAKAKDIEHFTYGAWKKYYYFNIEYNGKKESKELIPIYKYSDSKIAYSLDLFGTLKEYYSDFDVIKTNQAKYLKISNKKFQTIQLLTHFGYLYDNHLDNLWYAVTQRAIFQVLYPKAIISIADFANEKQLQKASDYDIELQYLVNNYTTTTIPGFLNINYGDVGIVKNKELSKFHVVNTNDNVSLINDTLTVSGNKDVKDIELSYGDISPIYDCDDGFPIIAINEAPMLKKNIDVNVIKGLLKVNFKFDYKYNSLCSNNASNIYGLFDDHDQIVYSFNLMNLSTFNVDNLKYGKYYIKQLSNACNTIKDQLKYELIIDSKNTFKTIDVKENVKTLKINKKICNGIKCINELGAKYLITNGQDNYLLTTNNLGNINLKVGNGKYSIKEIDGNQKYNYSDDRELDLNNFDSIINLNLTSSIKSNKLNNNLNLVESKTKIKKIKSKKVQNKKNVKIQNNENEKQESITSDSKTPVSDNKMLYLIIIAVFIISAFIISIKLSHK
jgi:hypothetical protein